MVTTVVDVFLGVGDDDCKRFCIVLVIAVIVVVMVTMAALSSLALVMMTVSAVFS